MSLQLMPFARATSSTRFRDFIKQLLLFGDFAPNANALVGTFDDETTPVIFTEAFDIVPRDELCAKRCALRQAVFVGGDIVGLAEIG